MRRKLWHLAGGGGIFGGDRGGYGFFYRFMPRNPVQRSPYFDSEHAFWPVLEDHFCSCPRHIVMCAGGRDACGPAQDAPEGGEGAASQAHRGGGR
jgi:hypothetical protein